MFISDSWQKILISNNFADFDALWNLKTDWFEEPNIRRGGWSGVVKHPLKTTNGDVAVLSNGRKIILPKHFITPLKVSQPFRKNFIIFNV